MEVEDLEKGFIDLIVIFLYGVKLMGNFFIFFLLIVLILFIKVVRFLLKIIVF